MIELQQPQALQYAVPFPKKHKERMVELARPFKGYDRSIVPTNARMDSAPSWTWANMDAADTMYIAQQLTEIRAGLYEIQYAPLKATRLMPFNTSIDRGAEQYLVRAIDRAGRPAPMKGGENNLPTLKASVKPAVINFHSWGLGYEYTMQEAHTAAFAGLPLSPLLAQMTREEQARNIDRLAFIGDDTKQTDVLGLCNQSGTTSYTVTTTGAGGLTTFGSKSTDNILLDMSGVINAVITGTDEVENPDTLLLPTSTEIALAQLRVGDGTSVTVLTYFKLNNPSITVERSLYLEANQATTVKRMVAYQNDPTRFEILVSVMFDQTAPEFRGYAIKTMTETRTAGCALYLPKSVGYGDNI